MMFSSVPKVSGVYKFSERVPTYYKFSDRVPTDVILPFCVNRKCGNTFSVNPYVFYTISVNPYVGNTIPRVIRHSGISVNRYVGYTIPRVIRHSGISVNRFYGSTKNNMKFPMRSLSTTSGSKKASISKVELIREGLSVLRLRMVRGQCLLLLKAANPQDFFFRGMLFLVLLVFVPCSSAWAADLDLELSLAQPGQVTGAEIAIELGVDSDARRMDELREALFAPGHSEINLERTPATMETMVSAQREIEKAVQGALRERGFTSISILEKRKQIRRILFPPQGNTYVFNSMLRDINTRGIDESRALKKVLRKIRSLALILWKEGEK